MAPGTAERMYTDKSAGTDTFDRLDLNRKLGIVDRKCIVCWFDMLVDIVATDRLLDNSRNPEIIVAVIITAR